MRFGKKYIVLIGLFISNHAASQIIGLLGGDNALSTNLAGYVRLDPPTALSLTFPPSTFPSAIQSVAINQFGWGLIGGSDTNDDAYAAYVNPGSLQVIPIAGLPSPISSILSVSINEFGRGIVGGFDASNAAYAGFVDPTTYTVATFQNLPPANSAINSVAINNCGVGLIGGNNSQAYAAFIESGANTAKTISGLSSASGIEIHSVALNDAGQGLIGGDDTISVSYAAYVNANTNAAIALDTTNVSLINSVAINDVGQGLIGGSDPSGGYAAYVNPQTYELHPITNLNLSNGLIQSVAINELGAGIVGGYDTNTAAYAAYVDPNTYTAVPITGLPGANSNINTVAINEFGQGLIGGINNLNTAYAAYVDPNTKTATVISPLPSMLTSVVNSVAIITNPRIPTTSLTANNLTFANYINKNARYDVFYFLPAICANTLEEALERAAPTRNAASLFTAERNMFVLNYGLSRHLRNHRYFEDRNLWSKWMEAGGKDIAMEASENWGSGELIASASDNINTSTSTKSAQKCIEMEYRPRTVWFEAIGAFAFQKSQRQTVGFDPSVGGFIFGVDKKSTENSLAGGGIAYTFTHIQDKEDQGHGDINQEYCFFYATWSDCDVYIDGALWAGFFQTHQVRDIDLPGFHFTSVSNPLGIQLAPHLEIGYTKKKQLHSDWQAEFLISPFIMIDYVNAWQQKYREHGNSPFNTEQRAHYSSLLRSEGGFRFYEAFYFSFWRLVLEEKCSYANTTSFGVGRVNAFLVGSPGSFTVETLSDAQNLGVVEASFIFEPVNHRYPYGSISYQGEFGGSFQSHQATFEVSWDF